MAWRPPVFNLLANVWICQFPADGAPDYADVPCQKFINSRLFQDVTPPTQEFWWQEWCPPVQLRFPRTHPAFSGPWVGWTSASFECPPGSGQYYRSLFREVQHEGFVNEYAMVVVAQCEADGKAVLPPLGLDGLGIGPDICLSPPPPPPPPPPAYYSDTFSDTAGTPLTSHVPDVGSGSYSMTGTWECNGVAGCNYVSGGTPPTGFWIPTDGSHTDGTALGIIATGAGPADLFGIMARSSSPVDGYLAFCDCSGGTFQLYKAVANVYTAIGPLVSGLTYPASSAVTVKITLLGTSVIADLNIGGVHSTSGATDSTWTTQSGVGGWSVTSTVFLYLEYTP